MVLKLQFPMLNSLRISDKVRSTFLNDSPRLPESSSPSLDWESDSEEYSEQEDRDMAGETQDEDDRMQKMEEVGAKMKSDTGFR